MRLVLVCLLAALGPGEQPAAAQESDPAYETLSKAFDSLRSRDYDTAIELFRRAANISPSRSDIRKNLAYTLLKTGENDAARMQFGEAMRLDPGDAHVALEYAFLSYEARDQAPPHKAEARRIFARVQETAPDAALRATAAQAFRNIDEPLAAGIARWRLALESSKPNFSAHYELAQLAEQRDELDLAAANYRAAFQLLPERKSVLIELARVEKARNHPEGAMAALLAASRGGEPRAAEFAREQLPARYPYVYEFRLALELDPNNDTLHRELAYLLLSMSENNQASRTDVEREFQAVVDSSPHDYLAVAQLGLLYLADHRRDDAMPLLNKVLEHAGPEIADRVRTALKPPPVLENRQKPEADLDPKTLGERSYQAGFLKDALRYFLAAREANPGDASVALKLGWTNNLLHDDISAMRWFAIARRSSDPKVAAEADKAWKNLRPANELFRTTVWIYPLYSSRWSDLFGYGQIKTEVRVRKFPVRPYLSVRFVGDVRRTTEPTSTIGAQSLSESAFIMAGGLATQQYHNTMAWFEAGEAVSYLNGKRWQDFRGGVSYGKTHGASIAAEHGGLFLETLGDSVFVSHFSHDLINYSQNRAGYTFVRDELKAQTFWAGDVTFDSKRQYWANFADFGPGFRIHTPKMPPSLSVTVTALRGVYLVNQGNPRGPNFNDFRVGVWYAFTK